VFALRLHHRVHPENTGAPEFGCRSSHPPHTVGYFQQVPGTEKGFEHLSGTQESLSQTGYHLSESLMKNHRLMIVYGMALLLCLAAPATCAVTPLWLEAGSRSGELSGVVISADGSTIITGGDQLISLIPDGRKRWSVWSGTCLAVSSDGDYILASKGQVVRLISSAGTVIWEKSMDITVTDLSMAPDASVIAATGGGKVRIMDFKGEDIASNATMSINHLKVMPAGDRILITTKNNVQLSDLTLIAEWSDTSSTQDLIAVATDGSSFVTATYNGVRMYNGSGSLIWDKKFSGGNARALAYSRDGSTIVIGLDDNTLRVLNHNGMQLFTANATNWITSVAVSDDGNTIAAGSLDKKLYVYNHAGTQLGTFTARSPIRFNSVAVTRDGSLIIVVDDSAVYGLLRSSFILQETTEDTITVPSPETTREVTTTSLPVTKSGKVTPRIPSLPTPYPTAGETPKAALSPAVPLMALGLLFLCRAGRK
jgi:WD40 repeat protein